jgi:hypothetical protein
MKQLFQFTTVKPSAEVIWNTLSTHEIEPSEGYTDFHKRFVYYCVLQLHQDFKQAKSLVNTQNMTTIIGNLQRLGLDTEYITSIKVPPADLPQWVHPELYIPYYMLKQLSISHESEIWETLFDLSAIQGAHIHMLRVDNDLISESITAYKLWYYGNDIIAEKYPDIFAIDNSLDPRLVFNQADILIDLNRSMYDHLTDSSSRIYDYSHKISIPPFTLGVSDASQ